MKLPPQVASPEKTMRQALLRFRISLPVLLLQSLVLLLLVFPFVSATFRDNDQATILSAARQLAGHQAGFFHATFYNFDKQWGSYFAVATLFRLFPKTDPVLAANVMLTVVASLAWLSLAIRTGRTRRAPLPLLLPVLLSPALILYIPFLGSGWLSLAFLLLAFFFFGSVSSRIGIATGIFLLAAATACRVDVVLALPALILSTMSRTHIAGLLRRPMTWSFALATVAPIAAGKLMVGVRTVDLNPLSFDSRSYFGFLIFGLTPAVLVLFGFFLVAFLHLAFRKRRFRFFYLGLAVAPLIPLAFYSPQLYGLRYLFLPLACVLFVASSRPAVVLYRAVFLKPGARFRWAPAALCGLTIIPWLLGIRVPSLTSPRLTITNPMRFPTGDGIFPMAGYLAFQWQVLFRDRMKIDHNQKIWLAARSVSYERCLDGTVPFLITPMSDFIEFAIRLQNKTPRPLDYMAESSCGIAFVDVRSIFRGYRPTQRDGPMFSQQITFVSHTGDGEQIARVAMYGRQTAEARVIKAVRDHLGDHPMELFLEPPQTRPFKITLTPGLRYALFSNGSPCRIDMPGTPRVLFGINEILQAAWTGPPRLSLAQITCSGTINGWAHTTLPDYMGL